MRCQSKKMGRPTKLTPEIREEIVELLKVGNYVETACAVVGISKTTYYDWIKQADESTRRNKYTIFRDEVEKAQAWSEARLVATLARHGEKYWQANAWLLERRCHDRWGRQKLEEEPKKTARGDDSKMDPVHEGIIRKTLNKFANKSKSDLMEEYRIDENGNSIN